MQLPIEKSQINNSIDSMILFNQSSRNEFFLDINFFNLEKLATTISQPDLKARLLVHLRALKKEEQKYNADIYNPLIEIRGLLKKLRSLASAVNESASNLLTKMSQNDSKIGKLIFATLKASFLQKIKQLERFEQIRNKEVVMTIDQLPIGVLAELSEQLTISMPKSGFTKQAMERLLSFNITGNTDSSSKASLGMQIGKSLLRINDIANAEKLINASFSELSLDNLVSSVRDLSYLIPQSEQTKKIIDEAILRLKSSDISNNIIALYMLSLSFSCLRVGDRVNGENLAAVAIAHLPISSLETVCNEILTFGKMEAASRIILDKIISHFESVASKNPIIALQIYSVGRLFFQRDDSENGEKLVKLAMDNLPLMAVAMIVHRLSLTLEENIIKFSQSKLTGAMVSYALSRLTAYNIWGTNQEDITYSIFLIAESALNMGNKIEGEKILKAAYWMANRGGMLAAELVPFVKGYAQVLDVELFASILSYLDLNCCSINLNETEKKLRLAINLVESKLLGQRYQQAKEALQEILPEIKTHYGTASPYHWACVYVHVSLVLEVGEALCSKLVHDLIKAYRFFKQENQNYPKIKKKIEQFVLELSLKNEEVRDFYEKDLHQTYKNLDLAFSKKSNISNNNRLEVTESAVRKDSEIEGYDFYDPALFDEQDDDIEMQNFLFSCGI